MGDTVMMSKRKERFGPYKHVIWISGTSHLCRKHDGTVVHLTATGEHPVTYTKRAVFSEFEGRMLKVEERDDVRLVRFNEDGTLTELLGPYYSVTSVGAGFISCLTRIPDWQVKKDVHEEFLVHLETGKKLGPFGFSDRLWRDRDFSGGTILVVERGSKTMHHIDTNGNKVFTKFW